MEIGDMTPQELRDLAARKEAAELHRSHLPEADRAGRREPRKRNPWDREVEIDGTTYVVDMRRFKSREFMRRGLALSEESPVADKVGLLDWLFEPIEDQILAEVEREVGYEDFDRYYEICNALFEAVQAKN